ncbi:MAG: SPFH domain-containing protein [Alistipes sp.]|nr:SPFH domain-containing protein [Alistipes sp.]
MSLLRRIKAELIDIVEYLDSSQDIIAHRFERHGNEIKNNARLVVREGQTAVFVNEGRLADVFTPGTYTLNTQNLPVLSTLKGRKYGFKSPFKAEVYFISTRHYLNQKWGTKSPIILDDQRFGMIELRAFGNYAFRVTDPKLFLTDIMATKGTFRTGDIAEQLSSIIYTRFSDAAAELNLPIEQYAQYLNELSELVHTHVREDFMHYGIDITRMLIENISMPDTVKKEIFEFSRVQKIDMDLFTRFKTAKSIEIAAGNENGSAGRGVGIFAGLGMGRGILDSMAGSSAKKEGSASASGAPVPPPLPASAQYYAAINGEPAGPFTVEQLSAYAKVKSFDRTTLVWKPGQADWCPAQDVAELDTIWKQVPPPIPNR